MNRKAKRSSIQLKHDILKILSNNEEHSISFLERKVKSDWDTIKNHCDELEVLNSVEYIGSKVKITEHGLNDFESFKKKLE